MDGQQLLNLASQHIGEKYLLGTFVPKNSSGWHGPWDCAEFLSWAVYQTSGKLYECYNDLGNPAIADAYTGYWKENSGNLGNTITIEQAIRTPGAAILRAAPTGLIGHIVFSDRNFGTIEARSHLDGVVKGVVNGRRWDYGILVPWITYNASAEVPYVAPSYIIYRFMQPMMVSEKIGEIQKALTDAGFDT